MLRIETHLRGRGHPRRARRLQPAGPRRRQLEGDACWSSIRMPEERRRRARASLKGIEHRVLGAGGRASARATPIADEDLERENEEKTSAVHFLRFELPPEDARRAAARCAALVGRRRSSELPASVQVGARRCAIRSRATSLEAAPSLALALAPQRAALAAAREPKSGLGAASAERRELEGRRRASCRPARSAGEPDRVLRQRRRPASGSSSIRSLARRSAAGRRGALHAARAQPCRRQSVSYEGDPLLRQGPARVYAYGAPSGWSRARFGEWRDDRARKSIRRWHNGLLREYFCPHRGTIQIAAEGVDALRRGGHPRGIARSRAGGTRPLEQHQVVPVDELRLIHVAEDRFDLARRPAHDRGASPSAE